MSRQNQLQLPDISGHIDGQGIATVAVQYRTGSFAVEGLSINVPIAEGSGTETVVADLDAAWAVLRKRMAEQFAVRLK